MTKKERLMAAVNGNPTDTMPYSFWTHLPGIDLDPVLLAEKTYELYKKYDWDFIKTMNNGMYAIEDFGCKIDYSEITKGGVAKVTYTPVQEPADWLKLTVTDVNQGSLARELKNLSLILEMTKNDDVPVIFTAFSPLTIANKISANTLKSHLEAGHSEEIHAALKVITETTCNLVKKAIEIGAAGIFFALQSSTYDFMTADEYREFGEPYDRMVLEAASAGWLNTIHCHGTNIMFEILKDYPVNVFNWHAWETLPSIGEAQMLTGKCLMGGLSRMDITNCRKNDIRHQIYECYRITEGKNIILTPGCVVRYPLNDDALSFIKKEKDVIEAGFRKIMY